MIVKINKKAYDTATAQKVITYTHISKSVYVGCKQERRTKRTIYCTRRGNWFETWKSNGGIKAAALTREKAKERLKKLFAADLYNKYFGEEENEND